MPLPLLNKRRLRQLIAWLALTGVVVVVADLGVGCYYATQINSGGLQVKHEPDEFKLTVETAGDSQVTLRHMGGGDKEDAEIDALWGVETATGYGRAGKVLARGNGTVTREFALLDGTLTAGQAARLDRHAFPPDPQKALGFAFEEVTYGSPLGPMPAWHIGGPSDIWAIFVHGVNGRRSEALRMLRPVVESGAQALVIGYRNDEGAPADPSGKYQYGRTEWQDVEAAAHYARSKGARRIVLVGYSMGGGIVVSFMRNSLLASDVSALVLDAPMLEFGATVDLAGRRRNLPAVVTGTAKWMTAVRYGVDWGALDYLQDAGKLKTPILLIHGDADTRVPIETSEALARLLPDTVQFERFSGAQHVGAWNSDRERYERTVREFLVKVLGQG